LFDDTILIENFEVWISTMSSASNRPFRHTATVASLAIMSALCTVGREVVEGAAKARRQAESEGKKSKVNKGRVQGLEQRAQEMETKKDQIESWLRSWFDGLWIHRYRDVDPKIRVDCIEALSEWITTYPDVFFDGNHLRYLGWVLSDPYAPSRAMVIKSLQKLLKDKEKRNGLKTFIERFRARIVEMATSDAEATVRASTVELLDVLREAELLEPDDIDSVGRLIFDSEPRVRKAVVDFFAENVNGVYEGLIDEMGGQESLDEALVRSEDDDDYDSPRLEWLKLKCLVEQLETYDAEEGELPNQIEHIAGSQFALIAAGIESRFSLAAQSLYDHIHEIRQWEILAGYLLFDHTQTTANGSTSDAGVMLQQNCKLTEREEIILLEILNAAVKISLANSSEQSAATHKAHGKGRLTKAQREDLIANQEEAVRHLALLIPQLLKKFGAIPDAASSVLNLERVLNLDVFQELRQDATFAALLDDINKQFLTHGNERVLLEASEALRHARGYEELREITDGKVQLLWDDTMNAFATLTKGRDLNTRGCLSGNVLTGITNTVLRIANLASISDCAEILEAIPAAPKPKSKSAKAAAAAAAATDADAQPPIASLIAIITRGVLQPDADLAPDTAAAEDALASHALRAILPYFMWKISHWKTAILSSTPIPDADITSVAARFDDAKDSLIQVMDGRKGADEIRVEAAGVLCDLYCVFMVLKDAKREREERKTSKGKGKALENGTAAEEDGPEDWEALVQNIDPDVRKLLVQVFSAAELAFAKRAGKKLEGKANEKDAKAQNEKDDDTDIEADPLSDDDLIDSDDEAEEPEDEDGATANARAEKEQRTLLAEKRLCEIGGKMVMAVLGGLLDDNRNSVKKRLERNRTKLGSSWREICAFLEKAKKGKGGKQPAKGKPAAEAKRSQAIVIEDEESSEDEVMSDIVDDEAGGEVEEEVPDEEERDREVESVIGD
jgi:cohesin complex subunit SA-1/2